MHIGKGLVLGDTAALPLTACNDPVRCALTQLPRVCSMIPNVRAAEARLCPDSTSRTASCLNSSVYCFRRFVGARSFHSSAMAASSGAHS